MMFAPQDNPRVFNIPMGTAFGTAFARGLLDRLDPADPLALARITVYAPTRRGARTISDALVAAAGGKPILAPRVLTLGDIDSPEGAGAGLTPAIHPTERLLALTRLVRAMAEVAPHLAQEATAVALATDLAQFLDQAHEERLSLDALEHVFPEDHAAHWSETLRFLDILRHAWPDYLTARGMVDPVARRVAVIERQMAIWAADPPTDPVIVAGSTGSKGISAELMVAVATLPQGAVILPGVDRHADFETFASLRDGIDRPGAPDHPQAGLSRLIERLGGREGAMARDDIPDWAGERGRRARFLSVAMRPAPVTDTWLAEREAIAKEAPAALDGVALVETETAQEEALAIAIAMRETLAIPDRTVALVTTDRNLSRRVSATLQRWGIRADDSGGVPLGLTPPGLFLSLLADEVFCGEQVLSGDPVRFLALLKNPLCKMGYGAAEHLRHVRRIELQALRADGRRHQPTGADLDAIEIVLRELEAEETLAWLERLRAILRPFHALRGQQIAFGDAIALLRDAAEAMALREDGTQELWEQANGVALRDFMDDLAEHAPALGDVTSDAVPMLLGGLIAGRSARAPYGQHPRVAIYGTLEARTQRADRMILGGLNEDSWPRLPDPDPWMSRAMRRAFGLPSPERRLGLGAHDFQQAFSADDVILTRARKADGTPTVPSRWLQRIVTLLGDAPGKGYAPAVLAEMRDAGMRYTRMAMGLEQPEGAARPCERPRATPPVAARPTRLSVTEVETLIRDPYAIYARHVLRLYPLPSLVPEPDARTRGEIMHGIVERFVKETQHAWPVDDPRALFASIADDELSRIAGWPSYQAFYKARADRVGPWFVDGETARREDLQTPVLLEASGSITFDVPGFGAFELRARVDRIDLTSEATYTVYDYKGANGPTNEQVQVGYAQQLPLQGAMVAAGAFDVTARPVGGLEYIKLLGGEKAGQEVSIDTPENLVENALPRLTRLIAAYGLLEQEYVSQAMPETVIWEGDYDHLARVGEWEERG